MCAVGLVFARKSYKRWRHVALGECHVAMELQHDVVEAMNLVFARKRSKNRAPRRIGGARCRDGAPTRRGCGQELVFREEKGSKVGATSHWRGAMSRWESNATWLRQGACFSGGKGAKSARHVALEESEVLLGLQRDVVEAASLFFGQKSGQNV